MAQRRRRHGCLTALLILAIGVNSVGALIALLAAGRWLNSGDPWQDETASAPLIVVCLHACAVVCAIAILKWKKWGFWGLCVGYVCMAALNVSLGWGLEHAFGGLVGLALLILLLNIGGEDNAWAQLE